MPAKHTALPWKSGCMHGDRKEMIFANGYALAVCQPDYRDKPNGEEREVMEANAALIVHRVNAFEGLVEALELCVEGLKERGVESCNLDRCTSTPCMALTAARAALKQAKEG